MEIDLVAVYPRLSERSKLEIESVAKTLRIEQLEEEVRTLRHTVEKLEAAVKDGC